MALNMGWNKIAIIAGIGVREYYENRGYHEQDTYMVKNLTTETITEYPDELKDLKIPSSYATQIIEVSKETSSLFQSSSPSGRVDSSFMVPPESEPDMKSIIKNVLFDGLKIGIGFAMIYTVLRVCIL